MMRPGTAVKRNFKVAAPKVQAKSVCKFLILFPSLDYKAYVFDILLLLLKTSNKRYLNPLLLGRIKTPRGLPLFEKARLRSSLDSSRV